MKKEYYHWLFVFLVISVFLSGCKSSTQVTEHKQPYVVMLSVDGFRWDYAEKANTPNLDYIKTNGVMAKSLKPAFPTKTFPNHYSMATGLYPDHHGIVLNSFYDEEMNAYYRISDRDAVENPAFYSGEPIWTTAEKQGVKAASFYWVGSEAPTDGIYPSIWKRYDHDFPFGQRIDSVISWLKLPESKRPHLITWYMHEPDNYGHVYGPDSPEIVEMVEYLDSLIGIFISYINELPYSNEINIIVTSDHGMGNISKDRVVIFDDYIDRDWFEQIQGWNPNYVLKVKEGYLDSAYYALSSAAHIKCWKSSEVPERLHYGSNPRTNDLVVLADSSWTVEWSVRQDDDLGAHGYDNDNTDMHGIFYAMGPAFKESYLHPTFENINLYPLITHILNIQPKATDGSVENIKGMLKD